MATSRKAAAPIKGPKNEKMRIKRQLTSLRFFISGITPNDQIQPPLKAVDAMPS